MHRLVSVFARKRVFNGITKTRLFNILKTLQQKNKENFQIKISDIFHIPAQNIDCGYSLEPPRPGGSNEDLKPMLLAK